MVRDLFLELYLTVVGLEPHSQTLTGQTLFTISRRGFHYLVVFLDRIQVEIVFVLTATTVLHRELLQRHLNLPRGCLVRGNNLKQIILDKVIRKQSLCTISISITIGVRKTSVLYIQGVSEKVSKIQNLYLDVPSAVLVFRIFVRITRKQNIQNMI